MGQMISFTEENGSVTISLSGRIDGVNAADAEKDILDILGSHSGKKISFDAGDLEYISSAGLRVLLKVQKNIPDGKIRITNVPRDIYDIFETTGFTQIFDVEKLYRRISVDGCEIIGRGFYGTVYRIDPETIVKVYESPESLSMINNEKRLAKTALVAGVPTAISYDIVRVGNSFGSVFELLNAKTMNDLLIENKDDPDDVIRRYAGFIRSVNEQTVPEGTLDSAKIKMTECLSEAEEYLDPGVYAHLQKLLAEIPEMNNIVHGDAQMKNVMVRDGEPMLIDMDTLSAGHPIFDLQSVYVSYFAFVEDDPDNSMDFMGISSELSLKVWQDFLKYYFGTDDNDRLSELRDKITIVGCIRFLSLISASRDRDAELFRIRVKHTAGRLAELSQKTDSLLFD